MYILIDLASSAREKRPGIDSKQKHGLQELPKPFKPLLKTLMKKKHLLKIRMKKKKKRSSKPKMINALLRRKLFGANI